VGARGAADRKRIAAQAKPIDRHAFIGGPDQDEDRARWCWDQVWIDPAFEALALHLGLEPDAVVTPSGLRSWSGWLPPNPPHVGGLVGEVVETATELIAWHLRGRVRAGGFAHEDVEITHRDGHVVVLTVSRPRSGPPQQPRILALALDALVLPWIDAVAGRAWCGEVGVGVEVDHPLAGMTAKAAAEFARDFTATTPSWRACVELEQAWGTRREQLLAFGDRMPEDEDL
jgi:hypothetical protein